MSQKNNEVVRAGHRSTFFDHNIEARSFQVAYNYQRTRCFIAYKILLTRVGMNMATIEFDGSCWGPARGIPIPKEQKHSVGDNFCVCFDPNNDNQRLMFSILENGTGDVCMRIGNSLGLWEEPIPLPRMRSHRYTKLAVTISDKEVFLFRANENEDIEMQTGKFTEGKYTWNSSKAAEEINPTGDIAAMYYEDDGGIRKVDVVYRKPTGIVEGANGTINRKDVSWNHQNLVDSHQISKKSPLALTRDNAGKTTMFFLRIQEGSDSRVPIIQALHLTRDTSDNLDLNGTLQNLHDTPDKLEIVGRAEPSSHLGAAFIEKPGKTARSYLFSVSKADGQNVLVMRERTELLQATGKIIQRWIIPNVLHTDPDPRPIGV